MEIEAMTTSHSASSAASQPAATQAQKPTSTPNQFHLTGGGLTISYFPQGAGPASPQGRTTLTYQDAHQSKSFPSSEVRTVPVADLGTIVSVTLINTVDTGYTSFSLLVPQVNLPPGGSAAVKTEGITTVHRAFVALIGHAQAETYTVKALSGTAADGILPA
jgi:hypothetical protein